ncbi:MAG: CoA pyrophosphatase [Bacteroidetes bacterium]|nr:CoA pyrophosphatase [Bacteroidota bacterium]
MNDLVNIIKARIALPLPGVNAQIKMAPIGRAAQMQAPENAKESGVLILLFMEQNQWHTLLMHRTEDGSTHGGQISFPGGKKEENDSDIIETASRECEEEIGIPQSEVQLVGCLTPLYIPPSNFNVTPVLGVIGGDLNLSISEREVQEIIKIPLSFLFDDAIKDIQSVPTASGFHIETPVYNIGHRQVVWGATAMMISELESLLKEMIS